MNRGNRWLTTLLLCVSMSGCGWSKSSPPTANSPVRLEELLGKWRMSKVNGQLPAAMDFQSLRIDLAADGTWTSEIKMQGAYSGITMKGGGKWSLKEGVIHYTSGENTGTSRVRLDLGRLVLDPDFTVRKDGTIEVPAEYERAD